MPLKLPLLPPLQAIVDQNGVPNAVFQQWWQQVTQAIESNVNGIQAALDAAVLAQDAASNANEAAATAQDAAETAQDAANASTQATALQGSYVDPPDILTAQDDGTSAEIDIAAHNRVYSDGTTIPVDSGSVTGLSYDTLFYIYYDDPDRTGGSVSYQATTDSTVAAQTGDRHTVGNIQTPAAAAPPSTGSGVRPPGVGTLPRVSTL